MMLTPDVYEETPEVVMNSSRILHPEDENVQQPKL
jgi:hypothetical protein